MDQNVALLITLLVIAMAILFFLTTAEPSVNDYHDPFDQEDL